MPAWILLLKIRKLCLPLPWFLFWIVLAPFVLIATLTGNLARLLGISGYPLRVMSESWRMLMMLTCLHGTEVSVNTSEENILIRFI